MATKRNRTMESMYPDKKARVAADLAVDGLSVEDTMLTYLITWEEAYVAAGGTIVL